MQCSFEKKLSKKEGKISALYLCVNHVRRYGVSQGGSSPSLLELCPLTSERLPQESMHYIMQQLEADFWRFQFQ